MSITTEVQEDKSRRAWPVLLLALPAFVAIWSGWVELGRLTGFGPVSPLPGIWDEATIDTAITLPIGVETYAAYAMYVWLALDVTERARRFACVSSIGSLVLGAAGQVAYHLMAAAGIERAPWPITALVACLPVAVLGMGAALAHLVAEVPVTAFADQAADQVEDGEHYQDDAEARTERAVVVNALRERHPDWSAEVIAGTAEAMASAEALPAPAPRIALVETAQGEPTSVAEASVPNRPAKRNRPRTGARTNAEKAIALRERHPDWTVARIAQRVGVTERTARRYFTAPAAEEQTDLAA
ncbi:helix-turn-helix domain-containing protein [Kineosporia rhizophila]|nr:helix-turn-helix domain-containing protein [Kineosporia rhizophila]MCE0536003.1 helix-turn-helix domain-containing protein [Kineosporia rhizophila]